MPEFLDPVIDQWYWHRDKGQLFYVVDIDEEARVVDIQHFDGDLEAVSLAEWRSMDIGLSEAPENWTGQFYTDTQTGLWSAAVFKHDVPEWRRQGMVSLVEARQLARAYVDENG